MQGTEHTPGPWAVNYDDRNGIYAVTDKPLRIQDGAQVYHSIKICAHDECDYDSTSKNERAANARLIASAPDLLRHLECAAWYWTCNLPPDAGPTEKDDLAAALSAIAKAKGGVK